MGRLFGTDGVRGLANSDLTAELALDLAVAAAHVLGDVGAFAGHEGRRPVAVVGNDSRASGEFLEAAVVAGLLSAGVDVWRVGVLPTPAVAYLTAALDADLGVMLSASHNPMPDNGIKILARGGHKLPDDVEDAIEARMNEDWVRPTGAAVGRVTRHDEGARVYVDHLLSTLPHRLDGLTVVVDGANGAASVVGPEALRRAGATVIEIHTSPNGLNINEHCGSTHLGDLKAAVVDHRADAGVAFDGDADRCLAVDGEGNVVDGDHILAILGTAMRERGVLAHDTVVATVMANLGFKLAAEEASLTVVETGVGDRYVLEAMREGGYVLGGEQSGHVILSEHATTGDGVLTALHLLARVAQTGTSLTKLASVVKKLPQVLLNVTGVDRSRVDSDEALQAAVRDAAAELGRTGRVLLRPSGTEPVVRVMVEAATAEQAQSVAERLAAVVSTSLG
ncbi:MAG TPA: phosphoglucosamine mutase [Candidatus Nanopelagicales bacterium]|nr:phosphoglucosamine mutase [Candidatus Nanopelagicales bacterium]